MRVFTRYRKLSPIKIFNMAAPTNKHDWGKRKEIEDEDDDEIDPVDEMIKKTGCLDKHHAVQDCMAEYRDWRKCQTQVMEFRKCVAKAQTKSW